MDYVDEVGARKVTVELTVDEWTFIVGGLRDLANFAIERVVPGMHPDDREAERAICQDNLDLADVIERSL
jgi:hypothetical protein